MPHTNRQLSAAIARLVDEFGAEVLLDVGDREPLTSRERIKARYRTLDRIQWSWPDGEPAKMLVLYDFAFGPERGTWRTPSAKLLRSTLTRGGIDVTQCAFACMWDSSPDDFKVTAGRIDEVSNDVRAVVRAADTDRVLVLGGNAGRVWNPKGDLTRLWGGTYLWPGMGQVFVRPVMLPGAVFRETVAKRDWESQIHGFIQEADENLGLLNLSRRCVACSSDVEMYDPFGVATCRQHVAIVLPGVLAKQPRRKQRETLDSGLSLDDVSPGAS